MGNIMIFWETNEKIVNMIFFLVIFLLAIVVIWQIHRFSRQLKEITRRVEDYMTFIMDDEYMRQEDMPDRKSTDEAYARRKNEYVEERAEIDKQQSQLIQGVLKDIFA